MIAERDLNIYRYLLCFSLATYNDVNHLFSQFVWAFWRKKKHWDIITRCIGLCCRVSFELNHYRSFDDVKKLFTVRLKLWDCKVAFVSILCIYFFCLLLFLHAYRKSKPTYIVMICFQSFLIHDIQMFRYKCSVLLRSLQDHEVCFKHLVWLSQWFLEGAYVSTITLVQHTITSSLGSAQRIACSQWKYFMLLSVGALRSRFFNTHYSLPTHLSACLPICLPIYLPIPFLMDFSLLSLLWIKKW